MNQDWKKNHHQYDLCSLKERKGLENEIERLSESLRRKEALVRRAEQEAEKEKNAREKTEKEVDKLKKKLELTREYVRQDVGELRSNLCNTIDSFVSDTLNNN